MNPPITIELESAWRQMAVLNIEDGELIGRVFLEGMEKHGTPPDGFHAFALILAAIQAARQRKHDGSPQCVELLNLNTASISEIAGRHIDR